MRTPSERELIARRIEERMHTPVSVAGLVFLLLVLADTVTQPKGLVGTAFVVLTWALWLLFVIEFVVRMVIAPSTSNFLKRNWWQIIFLVLPFFRFVRVLSRLRALRAGRVVSSATRTTRTAQANLGNRLAWLASVTVIVTLSMSQLLFEFVPFASYGDALYRTLLATISGEPLGVDNALAKVADVVLALYSVVVFASLAGVLGAFFLGRDKDGSA